MKPAHLALVLILLAPVTPIYLASAASPVPATAAQQDPLHTATPVELACTKVLLAQERAWNEGDLDKFAKAYKNSPDTLFISRDINRGFAGLLDSYHKDYPNRAAMGTLTFSDLEVHPLDDHFAVTLGKYHLERSKKAGGNADGIFSLVLEKTPEGWRIVVDHTS